MFVKCEGKELFWLILLLNIVLLLIYYFAFGVILNIRNTSGNSNYALEMFCGMAVFNIFAETVNSSAYSIISQSNLVKKAVFDLEVIPLSCVGCAAISGIIYLCVALVAATFYGVLGVEILKFPVLFVLYVLFCSGLAFFFSSISVFFPDLPMLLPVFTQALFFLTPIIYPRSVIPESLSLFIDRNPMTSFVCVLRASILNDGVIVWADVFHLAVWGIGCFLLGFLFFFKTKKGFSDVL